MKPNNKLKVGILGCANIARRYSIKAFQALDNVEVAFIASREVKKAEAWALEFGIPNFGTYEELINNDQVEAVYIPLPIGLHKEWILKAAESNKHIISEKSLAPDLESVKEIIAVCKKNGVVLFENFTCDYHPQHHQVVKMIQEGRIGEAHSFLSVYGFPIIADDNFRYKKELGGSALNESGAYQVYTARKLFAREPVSVMANLAFDLKSGVDMSGMVVMDFGNNLSAEFVFNMNAVYQNHYSVWGTQGLIKVGRAYAIPPDLKPLVEVVKNENRQETVTSIEVPASNHFQAIFADFVSTIISADNQKIQSVYESVLNQARVLEAIRVANKESRKVNLSEI